MSNKKMSHVKELGLLFGVPLAIIALAMSVIYVPRLLANPKVDFIYAVCSDYACKKTFTVSDSGRITEQINPKGGMYLDEGVSSLRYYDAETDSSKSISLEEARSYSVETSSRSSDGYQLTWESSDSGFLFYGSSNSGWYLKNGALKKKVQLDATNRDSYYSRNIQFIGWVE